MTRRLAAFVVAVAMLVTAVTPSIARVAPQAPAAAAAPAVTPVPPGTTPHYFGPWPNWANSPQTLPDATVTIDPAPVGTAVTVGNPVQARPFATDNASPTGTNTTGQGTVLVIETTPLPAGTLQDFQTFIQNDATFGGPGNTFNAYVLHPTGLNQYSIVYDSGPLTVPSQSDGTYVWPVTGTVSVSSGDFIGFYGQGIPTDITVGTDKVSYPALAAPTGSFTFGDASFPDLGSTRTYSFAATVLPPGDGAGGGAEATATVGAKGAVTGLTITNPGSGYTTAPKVTISSTNPAAAGATAEAVVQTTGAVTSVKVDAGGSGYTAPTVTFANGGASTQATGHVLGGVVSASFTSYGSGYEFPTVDFDLPDDPNGVQAQGKPVCTETDCKPVLPATSVTVTGILVTSPGSGYATAPGVVLRDGTKFDPVAHDPGVNPLVLATGGTTTLKIQDVVLDTFGVGYVSAPTVTFGGGGAEAAATATTNVGAITQLNLLTNGHDYLTPGGIKKFQDELPGLGPSNPNGLGQYIPVAVADKTTFPDADYYVIGVIQHRERMSSSLPAEGTLLREYVQLSTDGTGFDLSNDLLGGGSAPAMMPDGSRAKGVDNPHFLGPLIVAERDKAVRIVFYNLLPTGVDGDLFLPVDSTLMGSGMGPTGAAAPLDEGTVHDGVRDPECTESPKPDTCFADNRATLHLHGGVTPWISDGTPHQWITPADESTPWPEGVAVQNVPDMVGASKPADVPDCSLDNSGCQTFYYTNQQSARLMFYHDHSWGITRLNVYAGEAAGYVITDKTEQKLFGPTGTYGAGNPYSPYSVDGMGEGIPLVIQDRTFVPSTAQLLGQDPTWNAARWGGKGNLWYHHVYMPAQNPGDPSGMSAYGRWMYGPWFWPPATPEHPPIANPYYSAACNLDVPDTWQYTTDPFCEPPEIPGTPNISVGMEQFNDTPIVNGTAYPFKALDPQSYRFRILNAANDRFWNLQWYVADNNGTPTDPTDDTEVALDQAMVAAAQTDPNVVPVPDLGKSPAGPDWVQFGSEGGFLPAPTVVDGQQVTTWITDPTRFDVGNVDKHSLLLAPAERADVIVDFSQFAGKTLILYNDAPAAFPARVPSYDYYTGGPDGLTLPGYGPNTRTIMQIKVNDVAPARAFNVPALSAKFTHKADGSGVFEEGQHPIIVGQAAYNSAYGTSFAASGDCTNPASTIKCDGFARINQQGGDPFTFDSLNGLPTNKKLAIPLQPKALHDEMNSAAFDEFGRMTANLGLEAVPANPAAQNILLYPFIAPPTEVIDATGLPVGDVNVTAISKSDDGTQIWKITHNGVDTHPIHFHLYDVQILNRVTWDNIIIPTEASELGWKETIRVSPLEDTIVALRPIIPTLPFEIPNSIHNLSPMMPNNANLDPQGLIVAPNGTVQTVLNVAVNYGWEYVYHCHILSHEEMDMMRPVLVAVPPLKATGLARAIQGTRNVITFNDNSITETSFLLQRTTNGITWTTVATVNVPLTAVNIHQSRSITDTSSNSNTAYQYRVVARNTVGYGGLYPAVTSVSVSSTLSVGPAVTLPSPPNTLTATPQAGPQVRLVWNDTANNETGFIIERRDGTSGTFAQIAIAPARNGTGSTNFTDTTVATGTVYQYQVAAVNLAGKSAYSNIATSGAAAPVPAAPSNLTAVNGANQGNKRSVVLTWTDNSNAPNAETSFTIQQATNTAFTTGVATTTAAAGTTNPRTTTVSGLSKATTYYFRIRSNNAVGSSVWVNATPFPIVTNP